MTTRRAFITMLGGAAAAWPIAARAQQPGMPVVGFLNAVSAEGFAERLRAFRQGLKDNGYVEGENVRIEYRWAENQIDRLPAMAIDLVHRQVAVITATGGSAPALAAKAATTTIPVVFGSPEDPVKLGLVASLSRPGGNMTGINFFTADLVAKQLGLLRELVPHAVRVAVLINPAYAARAQFTLTRPKTLHVFWGCKYKSSRRVAPARSMPPSQLSCRSGRTHCSWPRTLSSSGGGFNWPIWRRATRFPRSYSTRDFPEAGGLMSYGTDIPDAYRQVGVYTGRVLKGAKPADMPVAQSTKFELVINLQTARLLGLTVPPTLLARADEVIE